MPSRVIAAWTQDNVEASDYPLTPFFLIILIDLLGYCFRVRKILQNSNGKAYAIYSLCRFPFSSYPGNVAISISQRTPVSRAFADNLQN
jgi:hypothetical protein